MCSDYYLSMRMSMGTKLVALGAVVLALSAKPASGGMLNPGEGLLKIERRERHQSVYGNRLLTGFTGNIKIDSLLNMNLVYSEERDSSQGNLATMLRDRVFGTEGVETRTQFESLYLSSQLGHGKFGLVHTKNKNLYSFSTPGLEFLFSDKGLGLKSKTEGADVTYQKKDGVETVAVKTGEFTIQEKEGDFDTTYGPLAFSEKTGRVTYADQGLVRKAILGEGYRDITVSPRDWYTLRLVNDSRTADIKQGNFSAQLASDEKGNRLEQIAYKTDIGTVFFSAAKQSQRGVLQSNFSAGGFAIDLKSDMPDYKQPENTRLSLTAKNQQLRLTLEKDSQTNQRSLVAGYRNKSLETWHSRSTAGEEISWAFLRIGF